MAHRSSHTGFWLLLLLMMISTRLYAQDHDQKQYSFDFRGEPLASVLEQIATQTSIDMVYDPKLVAGLTIYSRIHNKTVHETLKKILGETDLDFLTLSSGTIVIIRQVNEGAVYGSYAGKVVDQATGNPLPGATVMLADASGGTSAGPAGNFTLNRLISGSYKIIFSYVGYEAVSKTIRIRPNQHLRQKVYLKPKPVDFTPIVVTDHLPQLPVDTGDKESIDPDTPWEPTGRMQDAVRSLSLFSGVQYGLPMTDLHLQGGRRGEHRILLDGVPVYNPYSFGEMFSAFSPFAINKVDLYKAGYDVTHGSQIAGLINLEHGVDNITENRTMFQGDPLSVNLRNDLYFTGKGDADLKIMATARSNYWNIYKEPRLKNTLKKWDKLDPLVTNRLINKTTDASLYRPSKHASDVRFYDIHLASTYDIGSYRSLNTSFYIGKNYVNTDLLRKASSSRDLPRYLYAHDEYEWNNFMGQLTYHYLASSRLNLSMQLSYSANQLHHHYQIGTSNSSYFRSSVSTDNLAFTDLKSAGAANRLPSQKNKNNIRHFILRSDGTYNFSPHFTLEAGIKADRVESRVSLSDLFYLPTLSDQHSILFSSYLNSKWRFGKYWKLVIGDRLTFENTSAHLYTEPRASLQIDRPNSDLGYWSARISGGLYRQFINQYQMTNPGPTSLVPSFSIWSHAGTTKKPKAWHLSGSFRLEPSHNTTLSLDLFYKWQPVTYTVSYRHLLEGYTIRRSGFDAFAETTKMKALGAGFRIEHSLAQSKVKLMLGYDYSYDRIDKQSQFGKVLPTPWNEPHRLQLRILWRVIPSLTAVTKWKGIYGRTWGFRQSYYNYLYFLDSKNSSGYYFNHPENDRLSPFSQLDLSLIYKPELSFANLKLRLDLINVLNRHNTIDWSLQAVEAGTPSEYYKIRKRTMPGFSPSVSVELHF